MYCHSLILHVRRCGYYRLYVRSIDGKTCVIRKGYFKRYGKSNFIGVDIFCVYTNRKGNV